MKTLRWFVALGILFFVAQGHAQEGRVLKNQKEKISYSIGMEIGKNFKKQSIDVDPEILLKGIQDGTSGGKALMTEQEIRDTMTAFQKRE